MGLKQKVTPATWEVIEATCDNCQAAVPIGDCGHQGLELRLSGNYHSRFDTMGGQTLILCDDCARLLESALPTFWRTFEEMEWGMR